MVAMYSAAELEEVGFAVPEGPKALLAVDEGLVKLWWWTVAASRIFRSEPGQVESLRMLECGRGWGEVCFYEPLCW